MRQGQTSHLGLLVRGALAGLALAVWCPSVFAQAAASTGGGSTAPSTGTATTSGVFGSTAGTGKATTGTGAVTSPITKNNALAPYYSSPMTSGWGPSFTLKPTNSVNVAGTDAAAGTLVTGKGNFGVAMITATTAAAAAGKGGAGGAAGGTTTNAGTGFSSVGQKRTAAYSLSPSKGMIQAPAVPMQMAADLHGILTQSTSLASAKGLNVVVDDSQNIVIRGTVNSHEERQLAEALARMTPGTAGQFLRNEIVVVPPTRQPD